MRETVTEEGVILGEYQHPLASEALFESRKIKSFASDVKCDRPLLQNFSDCLN